MNFKESKQESLVERGRKKQFPVVKSCDSASPSQSNMPVLAKQCQLNNENQAPATLSSPCVSDTKKTKKDASVTRCADAAKINVPRSVTSKIPRHSKPRSKATKTKDNSLKIHTSRSRPGKLKISYRLAIIIYVLYRTYLYYHLCGLHSKVM